MSETDSGTQFDFTYAPGISSEQIIGFEMAGAIWSSYLQDDVTARIYVESTDQLPEDVVGAALAGKKKKVDYDKLWKEMSDDLTSSDDLLAFDNLPSTNKEFSVMVNGVELDKTKEFKLTNANAKALDLLDDDSKKLDGYIVVNDLTGGSAAGWDYDALRNDNISNNNFDFLSVAMHEIGHILGFVSGVDDDEWLKVLTESEEKDKEIKGKDFKFASALDLYRYSEASAAEGKLDMSIGGNPFFSIDGGNTKLGEFANGDYTDFGGDGYQASHWQQNSSQGIMDPVLAVGERKDISTLDLIAMDVIGWDLNTSETPSWQEIYDTALTNSETAIVADRTKDVEKMIKDSQYNGRYSPGGGSDYSFQVGYWQYTTVEAIDTPEVVTVDELETETISEPDIIVEQLETEIETDTNVFADTEKDENQAEDSEELFTTTTDEANLGTVGVTAEEQSQDSLFSEGLSEQTELDDPLESAILPELL